MTIPAIDGVEPRLTAALSWALPDVIAAYVSVREDEEESGTQHATAVALAPGRLIRATAIARREARTGLEVESVSFPLSMLTSVTVKRIGWPGRERGSPVEGEVREVHIDLQGGQRLTVKREIGDYVQMDRHKRCSPTSPRRLREPHGWGLKGSLSHGPATVPQSVGNLWETTSRDG